MIEMNKRYKTQLKGRTVVVRTLGVEQIGPHRGKWICLNKATGRKLRRTERQLHPVSQ